MQKEKSPTTESIDRICLHEAHMSRLLDQSSHITNTTPALSSWHGDIKLLSAVWRLTHHLPSLLYSLVLEKGELWPLRFKVPNKGDCGERSSLRWEGMLDYEGGGQLQGLDGVWRWRGRGVCMCRWKNVHIAVRCMFKGRHGLVTI